MNNSIPRPRTLFLKEDIFFPYIRLNNGKFPWEDTAHTAYKIQHILQYGIVHSVGEPLEVRFTRKIADLI